MPPEYRFGESTNRAVSKLTSQGIPLPEVPAYNLPALPADITQLDIKDLMVLFGEVDSWLDYIEVQLAATQIDEAHENRLLEELQASIQIENRTEKTVTAAKARVFQDTEFIHQRDRAGRAYGYRKIMETVYNRLDRQRFIISRDLSRRQGRRD